MPPPPATPPTPAPPRPVDVDTGFWLWVTALPLMLIGQIVDALTTPTTAHLDRTLVIVTTTFFALTLGGVVLGLMFLVRSGYRWARTVLTAGGVATIVYTAMSLLGVPRQPVSAVVYAVTGIVGSVLIGGGIYLLHRPDSQRFFIR